jgi:type VI secretion system protein ImpC
MDIPPNRLRLAYTVDDGDTSREVELPFVIGIMANLSGDAEGVRPLAEREFEEVNGGGVDRFLQAQHPRLLFDVPDHISGTGQLTIDLAFECLDDFTRARVADRIPSLRRHLDSRGGVDPNLTNQIDLIVQYGCFRELEATWRGLAYLLDHTTRYAGIKVLALHVAKTELYKSLQRYRGLALFLSPIFQKVYEERYDAHGGEPFGCLIGDYDFNHSDTDLLVLEEMGKLGAAAHCPFVAGLSPDVLHLDTWGQLNGRRNLHLTGLFRLSEYARWRSLRENEDSRYLVLTLPRLLAGDPFGSEVSSDVRGVRSERPVDLRINPAFAIGAALAASFGLQGSWAGLAGTLGTLTNTVRFEATLDADSTREFADCGILALPNEACLPTLGSCPLMAGHAEPVRTRTLQHILLASRFAHYIHAILRDKRERFDDVAAGDHGAAGGRWLHDWLTQYVDGDPDHSSETTKLLHPLTGFDLRVQPDEARRWCGAVFHLQLHGEPNRVPIPPHRCRRVLLEYDLEHQDAMEMRRLPFVLGVMADLAANSFEDLPLKFASVDRDSFDLHMRRLGPRVTFEAPDVLAGSGGIVVDMTFDSMADFLPSAVARKLDATRALVQVREDLAALLIYLDGTSDADSTLRQALAQPARLRETLTAEPDVESEVFNELLDPFRLKTRKARETVARALVYLAGNSDNMQQHASTRLVEELVRELDRRISGQVNLVMHHPKFQQLERTWLGVYQLVSAVSTMDEVELRVLNISKSELHKALEGQRRGKIAYCDIGAELGRDRQRLRGEAYGCVVCDYSVDHRPEDVELLGDLGELGRQFHCPMIFGAAPTLLQMTSWSEGLVPDRVEKIFSMHEYAAWRTLRESDSARYLAVALPRFLGRLPYDLRDARDEFRFIEDTADHEAYAWVNAAYAVGFVIARAFDRYGWPARICGVETGGSVHLPLADGAREAGDVLVPARSTETFISQLCARELANRGLIPLVCRSHSHEATFFHMDTMHKPPLFEDAAATRHAVLAADLRYLLAACRFAHYVQVVHRMRYPDRERAEELLNAYLMRFIDADPSNSSEIVKAFRPLHYARLQVVPDDSDGTYSATLLVRPHFQLGGLTEPLSLRLNLDP